MAAGPIHAGLALVLFAGAMSRPDYSRLLPLGLLAGASPALHLRRRWHLGEIAGTTVAVSLIAWSVAALWCWTLGLHALLAWWPAILAVAGAIAATLRRARLTFRTSPWDLASLLVMVPLVAFAALVAQRNGPFATDAGAAYRVRGWYGTDSMYLFALVQSAQESRAYPSFNPFCFPLPNRYPSLLHCGLAAISSIGNRSAPRDIWLLFPFFAASSAPLLAMAAVRRAGRLRAHWLRSATLAAGSACIVLSRPDLFVYPHTQSFALPLLWLLLWLLGPTRGCPSTVRMGALVALTAFIATCHAVTALVAIALLVLEAVRLLRAPRTRRIGLLALAGCGLASALLAVLSGHAAGIAIPSDWHRAALTTAAHYLLPWVVPATAAVLAAHCAGRRGRSHLVAASAIAGIGALGTLSGIMAADDADAWFLMFNARRFYHLALAVAIPLFLLVKGRRSLLLSLGALFSLILAPSDLMLETLGLLSSKPSVASAKLLDALDATRRIAPMMPIETDAGAWLPAFTGRPAFVPSPVNLWAHGTLSNPDYAARLADHAAFFGTWDWEERIAAMRRRGSRWLFLVDRSISAPPRCTPPDGPMPDPCLRLAFENASARLYELARTGQP